MPDKRSAAGGGGGGGKRKKAKYINGGGGGGGSGAARRSTLPTGRRGFLVTCEPRHDVRAGREAVALLGEFIDRALAAQGGESGEARGAGGGGGGFSSGGGSGGGVAAALEGELAELRTGGVGGERALRRVETGVLGSFFLALSEPRVDPSAVVAALLAAAAADPAAAPTATRPAAAAARYCVRFVPVAATVTAAPAAVAAAAATAVRAAFPRRPVDWAVVYRCRHNDAAVRDDYTAAVGAAVAGVAAEVLGPGGAAGWRVALDAPDAVVLVEVLKTAAACRTLWRPQ